LPPPNGLQSKHPNLNKVDPFLNTSPSLTSLFEPHLNYTSNQSSNSVNSSPQKEKEEVSNNFRCKCIKNKIIIRLVSKEPKNPFPHVNVSNTKRKFMYVSVACAVS
jgi:hypothetical protein